MPETPFDRRAARWLADAASRGRGRRPPPITARRGATYELHGRRVLGLCSNDYLGFADHPRLRALEPTQVSATASRLVCGDLEIHRHVEARLATLVNSEAALLFPSGAQLNVGVLASVLRAGDTAYSDALAHASLVDGLRLAKATRVILPHGAPPPVVSHDTDARVGEGDAPLRWWISESIFSMDGDRFDAEQGRAFLRDGGSLYLDEAHAIGLFPGGRGWSNAVDLQPTLRVGTLGKAYASAGAFIAGSRDAIAWIAGHARSFVYSTGTSPLLAAQIDAALDLVSSPEGDERRERLWRHVEHVAARWERPATSPIFPILVGDDHRALAIANALLERGLHVQPIRPPTVPEGTARLRLTVSAALDETELDDALAVVDDVCLAHGVDPRHHENSDPSRDGARAETSRP